MKSFTEICIWFHLALLSFWCSSIFSCPYECICNFSPNTTAVICSNIDLVEFPYSTVPGNTTSLSIEFTNLSVIHAHHLHATPFLQELHLSGNKIHSLPPHLLKGLHHLHTLDLTGNQLGFLPAGVFYHAPLKNLILRDNRLMEADANWLPYKSNLTWLDLAGNRLTKMPVALLQKLPCLQNLHLHQNLLEEIPSEALTMQSQLSRLHLEENKLRSVQPSAFHHSTRLIHLFLQKNRLEELPPELFQRLSNLYVLDVSENPWACTRDISYLWKWLLEHKEKVFSAEDIHCVTPEALKGRLVLSLTKAEIDL